MKRLILVLSFLGTTSLTYAKEVSYVSISKSLLIQKGEDSLTEETLLILNNEEIEASDFWDSEQLNEWQKKKKNKRQLSKARRYHDDDDDDDDDDDNRRRRYNKRYKKQDNKKAIP